MERGDGSTPTNQRYLECTQVLAQDFVTTLELSLSRRKTRSRANSKARGSIQCFLDPTCKEIARGSLTAKDVWETLKNQLERKDSYTKTHLLTFLCTLSRKEALLTSIVASSQWKLSEEDSIRSI